MLLRMGLVNIASVLAGEVRVEMKPGAPERINSHVELVGKLTESLDPLGGRVCRHTNPLLHCPKCVPVLRKSYEKLGSVGDKVMTYKGYAI